MGNTIKRFLKILEDLNFLVKNILCVIVLFDILQNRAMGFFFDKNEPFARNKNKALNNSYENAENLIMDS